MCLVVAARGSTSKWPEDVHSAYESWLGVHGTALPTLYWVILYLRKWGTNVVFSAVDYSVGAALPFKRAVCYIRCMPLRLPPDASVSLSGSTVDIWWLSNLGNRDLLKVNFPSLLSVKDLEAILLFLLIFFLFFFVIFFMIDHTLPMTTTKMPSSLLIMLYVLILRLENNANEHALSVVFDYVFYLLPSCFPLMIPKFNP